MSPISTTALGPSGLMPRHTVLSTRDLDEACEFAARAWRPYHHVEPLRRQAFSGLVQHVRGRLLAFTYFDTVSHIDVDVGELEGFATVHFSFGGTAEHYAGPQPVSCEPGAAVVHSSGQRIRYRRQGPGRFLVVRVDESALVDELEAQLGASIPGPLTLAPALALAGPAGRLVSLSRTLATRLDSLPARAPAPFELLELERAFLSTLLEANGHSWIARLSARPVEVGAATVRQAEDFMRARLQHPLSSGEIARAAGVSARTLFRSFQRRHGCAPMQYVRRARLEQVRRDLLSGGEGVRVADLALAWGFTHLGRFAGQYRAVYGETPSQTLERVRRRGRVA
jgi:AraC-like DNA-binding protein